MLKKIVSGGQAGVDRAALDAALAVGFPCGGWCPRGRLAEDGPLPPHYPLVETTSQDYAQRTEWNVRDSDATLILTWGKPTGGTALTIELARQLSKPHCLLEMHRLDVAQALRQINVWFSNSQPQVLNVAGPRASSEPRAYETTLDLISAVIKATLQIPVARVEEQ